MSSLSQYNYNKMVDNEEQIQILKGRHIGITRSENLVFFIRVTASPKTAGNEDFSPKTFDITFQPGEKGPKSIAINIMDDDIVETTEEFTVSLSSSSPGVTLGEPATVVIRDKPGERFTM